MFVKIGGTTVVYSTYATRPVGLTLTIINAKTHEHESSNTYAIYSGNGVAAHMTNANNLGNALLSLSNDQIGILTSYGAFEDTNSTILKNACYKLGLTRLAAALDNITTRAPYVSIFYGSGNVDNAGNQALEIMKTNSSTSAYATLSTFLIDDAFIGQQITNALYNPHSISDNTGPSVFVDYTGNVGIGTTDPNTTLDVSGTIKANKIETNRLYTPFYKLNDISPPPDLWALAGDTKAHIYNSTEGSGDIDLSNVSIENLNGIPFWFFFTNDSTVDIYNTISHLEHWTVAIATLKNQNRQASYLVRFLMLQVIYTATI